MLDLRITVSLLAARPLKPEHPVRCPRVKANQARRSSKVFPSRVLFARLAVSVLSIWLFVPVERAHATPDEDLASCVVQAKPGLAAQTVCIGLVAKACLADPSNTAMDEKIECVQREFVVWDLMMKREYAALLANLKDPATARLKEAQKRWVAFQKKNCRLPYALFSSAKAALAGPWCSVDAFAVRALNLRAWRQDLGLPPPPG